MGSFSIDFFDPSESYIVNKHKFCGSNDFQDYFDDAKESRVKQVPKNQESKKLQESSFKESIFKNNQVSRFKIQDSRTIKFQDSRTIKFQESRFKNNQDQDSRNKRRLNQDKYLLNS